MERLMTAKTLDILKNLQIETQQRIREMGGESEGGHARAGFHDDAGFEHEKNRVQAELLRIGNLNEAFLIEPPTDIEAIKIGHKVKTKFIEENTEEVIYLLGEDDVIRRNDLEGIIVSASSPLGLAINGKSKNETVEVKIGSSSKIHVQILDIEKGDF